MGEAQEYSERPNVLAYRVGLSQDEIKALQDWRREVDSERATRKEQVGNLETQMVSLTKAFESLRKALIGFALTIAGSAIVFAFTVLVATGKLSR